MAIAFTVFNSDWISTATGFESIFLAHCKALISNSKFVLCNTIRVLP